MGVQSRFSAGAIKPDRHVRFYCRSSFKTRNFEIGLHSCPFRNDIKLIPVLNM